jgi:single-strand DNA-binding protein
VSDANVSIVGNVTRDPELRFTPGGQAITSFSVAVSRRYQQNGEWKEQSSFFDVKAWQQLGENVAASISKGTRVIVTGRLEQETWPDKDTGATRSKVVLVADGIGPDLRWATVVVERNERSDGNTPAKKPATPAYADGEEPW